MPESRRVGGGTARSCGGNKVSLGDFTLGFSWLIVAGQLSLRRSLPAHSVRPRPRGRGFFTLNEKELLNRSGECRQGRNSLKRVAANGRSCAGSREQGRPEGGKVRLLNCSA